MATIKVVKARQIFDSRGNPTVEVDITFPMTHWPELLYQAVHPPRRSVRLPWKSVSKAVANVNTIIGPALVGKDPTNLAGIVNFMVQQLDGTQNEWGWCKQNLVQTPSWQCPLQFARLVLVSSKPPLQAYCQLSW
ncbi:hypothetical protein L1987_46070 [Smallanthus sonchifolius]|uniref:Uncharacterized protein n=1 Tax=Smallanthus sonchifolius TaxID=185202 RepID=A0ACB9FYG3_9ASTR|nr:hypothetical protein L1987_46070 [Smallanthus sonchifolius]